MFLSTPLIGLGLCAVATGIAFGVLLSSFYLWVLVFVLCTVGVAVAVRRGSVRQSLVVFTGILLIFLGMFRVSILDPVRIVDADAYVDTSVTLVGTISSDPDRRTSSVLYVLTVEHIAEQKFQTPIEVLAILPRYPEYRVGDSLTLSGKFTLPEDFDTDPLRPPFPYVRYLAKDGIGYILKSPRVQYVRAPEGVSIFRTLSDWKRAILEKGNVIFPEPEGGLLAGMILGEKHALPKDILADMRIAGLVHIIVVSGYNMTIVAEGVSKVFRFLPLVIRSSIGFLVIWIYAGMVSGGAPVIRAAIMTSFALLARMTGNTALALRLLYVSAIIMVLQNPRIVLDDASFHLSFLATLGLIVLSPKVTMYLSKKEEKKVSWWKELFSATLSAQLMVMPYILFFSGQLSPYALFANLLALPVVPLAMASGVLAIFVSSFFHWMGAMFGAIASVPAWWVLRVGEWFAGLPGSDVVVAIPLWGALLLYAIGGFFFWKSNRVDVLKK